mmetsp:Transcript_11336/g.27517  ORF Transcript_11336/g.27517 Transcript_11336/m.27517 type:complete len:168 (-) Transcript_11336:85-588(-)
MAKTCGGCSEEIVAGVTYLTAEDKLWHEQCFQCSQCKKPLSGTKYFIKDDGSRRCAVCAAAAAGTCHKCKKSLLGDGVVTQTDKGGNKYHDDCFTCMKCEKKIPAGEDYISEKYLMYLPYCLSCHPDATPAIIPAQKGFKTSGRWANRADGTSPMSRWGGPPKSGDA